MSFEAAVHAQAVDIDILSLNMTAAAGSGHPTTASSLGHLVTVLMFNTMRWSPEHPDYPTSDRLVLSEGHAVPIVYAAAAKLGVHVEENGQRRPMQLTDLDTLREANSTLDGHPNPVEGMPFFDAATGSLGQGLSVAAGVAKAARLDGTDRRVYCIIGDGESREGQIPEALDFIVDHELTNVCTIFNCNEYGQADKVSNQQSADVLKAKLEAFNFEVVDIDGHAPQQIKDAFDRFAERADAGTGKPIAIIARTVKGWGSPSLQGGGWHGKPAKGEQLEAAISELAEKRSELTSSLTSTDAFTIQPPAAPPEPKGLAGDLPTFTEFMKQRDMESVLTTGKLATRRAYGIALHALSRHNPDIVTLDADVSNSTFANTVLQDPETAERFVECKIAEQNMISVAAGLSAAGKIPFCSTFAKFFTRAYDQIEMAINSGANFKLVGSHAGVSLAADGPSQMSLPDVAWFRSFGTALNKQGNPACYVIQPSDAFSAYALTAAMAEYDGPCYMRTLRPDTEFLYTDEDVFNLGGFQVLSEGRDLLIVASGYMVHEANKALQGLDDQGVSATLVDLYSLPFDAEKLLDLANENNGYVLTLEDNYGGGFGSAVADALAASGEGFTLDQMYVRKIPKSARTPEEIMSMVSLTPQDIVDHVLTLLQVNVA
ncbi:MAG: transketolase [Planctomycetota bacterium]